MNNDKHATKVGVYVDVANVARNGGYGMRYDILRDFACRDNAEALRLNAYAAFDEERAGADDAYRERIQGFHFTLRDFGFKVIEKTVKWYTDEGGNRFGKANSDLDMAVDAILQSENLDRVMLVTGDGDFVQVVRALQNKGCRVEVVAFKNVSGDLRREADMYLSGYLVPNLLPVIGQTDAAKKWGEVGARVRGTCYTYHHAKRYGFIRFLTCISPGLWLTDSRREGSPYQTAFVHETAFASGVDVSRLPSRDFIFEFELTVGEKGFQAVNVSIV
ncbi:MAG: NYN domain-containing protein [Planctomycetota bacterium]|nr:NYN domain-containing protein [Planctomycetota bacterium]